MLIGLHGKKRSGKDTSYTYIAEWAAEHAIPVRRDAFADRLKVSAARALGYTGTQDEILALWDRMKEPGWEIIVREPMRHCKEHVLTPREFIQLYGDEAHRQVFGTDFWVKVLFEDRPYRSDELLVLTDVRYVNEAQAVQARGGQTWHIRRTRVLRPAKHLSEQPLPTRYIDHLVINDHDLPTLRTILRKQLDQWIQSPS